MWLSPGRRWTSVAPRSARTTCEPWVFPCWRDVSSRRRDTRDAQRVAVVNQALVDRYWPHRNAIGKRLWAEGRWFTVVAVARNSNYDRLDEAPMPFLYLPIFQVYYPHP